MPAKSKTQQRLMGMVYAYKKGDLDTSKMDNALVSKIKSIAKSMTMKDAKKYAETGHEGLPEEVKETHVMSFIEFLTEGKHDLRAQVRRRRAPAGAPQNNGVTLQSIYNTIKKNKGEVDFSDFMNKVIGKMNLSPEGWNALSKTKEFQDFVSRNQFKRQDPWQKERVAPEDRASYRQAMRQANVSTTARKPKRRGLFR